MMFRATQLAGLYLSVAQAATGSDDGSCSLTCVPYVGATACGTPVGDEVPLYDVSAVSAIVNPTTYTGAAGSKGAAEDSGKGYPAAIVTACTAIPQTYPKLTSDGKEPNANYEAGVKEYYYMSCASGAISWKVFTDSACTTGEDAAVAPWETKAANAFDIAVAACDVIT